MLRGSSERYDDAMSLAGIVDLNVSIDVVRVKDETYAEILFISPYGSLTQWACAAVAKQVLRH